MTLDLFSGTGGISWALRGIIDPTLAYIEIAPTAQACLRDNIARGYIHDAPIHSDVSTFDATKLKGTISTIVAGSPCVGFSVAGKRGHFSDPRSNLFFHVVRIANECQPQLIILENVTEILLHIDTISKSLCDAGYDMCWTTAKGWQVGGLQHRHRWYCVAMLRTNSGYIPSEKASLSRSPSYPYKRHNWSVEHRPRMIAGLSPSDKRKQLNRVRLAGNSIIPDALRSAVLSLMTGHVIPVEQLLESPPDVYIHPRELPRKDMVTNPRPKIHHGVCIDGVLYKTNAPTMPVTTVPDLQLRLIPISGITPSVRATSGIVTSPVRRKLWCAARHKNVSSARVLTKRSADDLLTQVRFEAGTENEARDGVISGAWIDWLQGFPEQWTNFDL